MESFQAGVSLGFVAVVLNSCVLKAIPRSEYEQIKQKYGVK